MIDRLTNAFRQRGLPYLAHLFLCSYLFASSAHAATATCCYSDACNGDTICAKPTTTLIDSCGVRYTVSRTGCVLTRQSCCFIDACNKSSTICSAPGDTLVDSCKKAYRVSRPNKSSPTCNLSLLRRCCYLDACLAKSNIASSGNKNNIRICALRSYTFTDTCGVTYRVDDNKCTLRRVSSSNSDLSVNGKLSCCYIDACNGRRICKRRTNSGDAAARDKDNILTDSCGKSYLVADDCKLSFINANKEGKRGVTAGDDKCCYKDACSPQKTICAPRGGVLPDSCGRAYVVSTKTCILAGLQCCAVDKCTQRSDKQGKLMMMMMKRSSSQSRTVCSRVSFPKGVVAGQLAKHDLFCTGFKAAFRRCDATRGNRLALAATGVEEIVRATLVALFNGKRNVIVQVTLVNYGNNGVTARPLLASMGGQKRARIWSVGVKQSKECIGKRCAARVEARSTKKLRVVTVQMAMKKLLGRPDWTNVFRSGPSVAVKRQRRRNGRFHYVAILQFRNHFEAEFRR